MNPTIEFVENSVSRSGRFDKGNHRVFKYTTNEITLNLRLREEWEMIHPGDFIASEYCSVVLFDTLMKESSVDTVLRLVNLCTPLTVVQSECWRPVASQYDRIDSRRMCRPVFDHVRVDINNERRGAIKRIRGMTPFLYNEDMKWISEGTIPTHPLAESIVDKKNHTLWKKNHIHYAGRFQSATEYFNEYYPNYEIVSFATVLPRLTQ